MKQGYVTVTLLCTAVVERRELGGDPVVVDVVRRHYSGDLPVPAPARQFSLLPPSLGAVPAASRDAAQLPPSSTRRRRRRRVPPGAPATRVRQRGYGPGRRLGAVDRPGTVRRALGGPGRGVAESGVESVGRDDRSVVGRRTRLD